MGQSVCAAQFGGFFMITGFHGLHVSIGVVYALLQKDLTVMTGLTITKWLRSQDYIGTLSIWSGYSFSHSFIYGRS